MSSNTPHRPIPRTTKPVTTPGRTDEQKVDPRSPDQAESAGMYGKPNRQQGQWDLERTLKTGEIDTGKTADTGLPATEEAGGTRGHAPTPGEQAARRGDEAANRRGAATLDVLGKTGEAGEDVTDVAEAGAPRREQPNEAQQRGEPLQPTKQAQEGPQRGGRVQQRVREQSERGGELGERGGAQGRQQQQRGRSQEAPRSQQQHPHSQR